MRKKHETLNQTCALCKFSFCSNIIFFNFNFSNQFCFSKIFCVLIQAKNNNFLIKRAIYTIISQFISRIYTKWSIVYSTISGDPHRCVVLFKLSTPLIWLNTIVDLCKLSESIAFVRGTKIICCSLWSCIEIYNQVWNFVKK